ncbi:hypothetical protein GCM10022393_30270 [Aquimarina addita]|uniref:Putative auto-transporter adhesin head GIN domain-containing protein n=1 Tax=Aquimarina addita TaxID=870485 RepID=A0ABP6URA0_9FLAO
MSLHHQKNTCLEKIKALESGILKLAFLIIFLFNVANSYAQNKTIIVDDFQKIIISPHIQVTFKQGTKEEVFIEEATIPMDKINIEVHNKTLRIYLDDAKTKTKTVYKNGSKQKTPIYKGTIVKAIITYKNLNELSLRGEQTFVCESLLDGKEFQLKIFGESRVYLNEVQLKTLHATIYGESLLEIKKGTINKQKFTAYGESKINALGVNNNDTKITAFGAGSYRFNVSDQLKITAFGEAVVAFEGNPAIDKGIVIGEATIQQLN